MGSSLRPDKDPARRCLRVEEWPAADQRAWCAAIEPGDVLDPGGVGATWAPHTHAGIVSSYGRWLTWLAATGQLDPSAAPADRVTPDRVATYVEELQRLNAPSTVLTRVRFLACALNAMVPGHDWDWLWNVGTRLKRKAHLAQNKGERLVPQAQLLALGRSLMAEADARPNGSASRRAARYRDGLMIAVLAARPLRLRNFTAIEIGRHLVRAGNGYVLLFKAKETKTRVPLEFPFPASLIPALERYRTEYRPVLVAQATGGHGPRGRGAAGNALWVSTEGSAMSQGGIYGRIVELTTARLGKRVNPHLFRTSAATSVALNDPDHLHINKSILGHTTIATSERYYNHGQALGASDCYQDQILAMRRELASPKRRRRGSRPGGKE